MPFAFDSFIVEKEKPAFAVVMRRYSISMGEAQKIIDRGRMLCNGTTVTQKNQKVAGSIKVLRFFPKSRDLPPLFIRPHFMVFEKPSGVLVHPNKVLTPYSMLDEIRHYGGENANSVHRIDMETSGLLLASKNRETEILLKGMFEQKRIKKSYLAWVHGNTKEHFFVDAPIKVRTDYSTSKHKVAIDSSGKSAKTEFTKLLYNRAKDATLLHVNPLSGRTHQIRIHLFHVKHPIIGDPLYGTPFEIAEAYLEERLSQEDRIKYTGAKRLMLHADTLEFKSDCYYYIKSQIDFRKEIDKIERVKFSCFT